jgi:phage FluMu protein Com
MPIYDFKCNNCNKINEYYVPTIHQNQINVFAETVNLLKRYKHFQKLNQY